MSHVEITCKIIICLYELEKKNNKFLLSLNSDKVQICFWTNEDPLVVEFQ